MSQTLKLHVVLRPIAIAGERVEPDSLVELGPVLGAELRTAGKVRLATEAEAAEADAVAQAADAAISKPAEPAPKVRKAAKAEV